MVGGWPKNVNINKTISTDWFFLTMPCYLCFSDETKYTRKVSFKTEIKLFLLQKIDWRKIKNSKIKYLLKIWSCGPSLIWNKETPAIKEIKMTVYHLHSFDRGYRSMYLLFKLLYRGFVFLLVYFLCLLWRLLRVSNYLIKDWFLEVEI